jgi:hypothetical protein
MGCSSISHNEDEVLIFLVTSPFSKENPFDSDSSRNIVWHREAVLDGRRIRGTDASKIKGIPIQEQGTHVETESYRLIEPAFWYDAQGIADRIAGTGPYFHRGYEQGKRGGSGHGTGCCNRCRGDFGGGDDVRAHPARAGAS